ncbi:hypothetical protein ZHAS_00013655 [Anopheles sinensis]|uniref:Uncharacterized protein n=1 Tax=Anopheles sinensis TaxID=74873 RepID=A0A084W663_ANOSI|nr:hypothetical protein ZHAS_00013655 [Anopheles sinensis]
MYSAPKRASTTLDGTPRRNLSRVSSAGAKISPFSYSFGTRPTEIPCGVLNAACGLLGSGPCYGSRAKDTTDWHPNSSPKCCPPIQHSLSFEEEVEEVVFHRR